MRSTLSAAVLAAALLTIAACDDSGSNEDVATPVADGTPAVEAPVATAETSDADGAGDGTGADDAATEVPDAATDQPAQ